MRIEFNKDPIELPDHGQRVVWPEYSSRVFIAKSMGVFETGARSYKLKGVPAVPAIYQLASIQEFP